MDKSYFFLLALFFPNESPLRLLLKKRDFMTLSHFKLITLDFHIRFFLNLGKALTGLAGSKPSMGSRALRSNTKIDAFDTEWQQSKKYSHLANFR